MCRQSDRCPYASGRNDLGDEEEGGDCRVEIKEQPQAAK